MQCGSVYPMRFWRIHDWEIMSRLEHFLSAPVQKTYRECCDREDWTHELLTFDWTFVELTDPVLAISLS
jgi:hypothetical protein